MAGPPDLMPGAGVRSQGSLQGRPLVFLHIPRTGGTTLTRLLRQQYPRDAVFIAESPGAVSAAEQFAALPEPTRRRTKLLLIGHDEYTEHEAWPVDAVYISLLRDPISRVISTYRFIHDHPADGLYEQVVGSGMSLRDFVTSDLARTVNDWQARCMAGLSPDAPAGGAEVLDRARETIERRFDLVGLSERFPETVALLSMRFGFRRLHYQPLNVSRTPATVSPDDIELIRAQNATDCELYRFAAERLERELEGVPGVQRHLRSLDRRNRLYAPIDGAYRQARRVLHAVRSRGT